MFVADEVLLLRRLAQHLGLRAVGKKNTKTSFEASQPQLGKQEWILHLAHRRGKSACYQDISQSFFALLRSFNNNPLSCSPQRVYS